MGGRSVSTLNIPASFYQWKNLFIFRSKSEALGNSYIIIGVLSLLAGCVMFAKRLLFPRPLGDIKALEWVQK